MLFQKVKFNPTILLLCILLVSYVVVKAQSNQGMSPAARAYLQDALDVMQKNSLRKRQVDWEASRRQTLEKAAGAQVPTDTYEAIRFALHGLGDNHSFLQLSKELTEKENARRNVKTDEDAGESIKLPSQFSARRQPEGYLHKVGNCIVPRVVVPLKPFAEMDVMNAYAAILYKFIVDSNKKEPCGWIIDLRGNGGGAVFPMLAGIGLLLGDGDMCFAVDADGLKTAFFYKGGQSGVRDPNGKETILTRIDAAYQIRKQVPVAVLIDGGTGSSGEAVAVALRGRINTRFFGMRTFGASTSTEGFELKDGANMVLATAVDVDRNGKMYPEGIVPDELVAGEDKMLPPNDDPVIHAALGWLGEQN